MNSISQTPKVPDLAARLAQQQEPAESPVQRQTWSDLLFAHWRVEPQELQSLIPNQLTIDTFDGSAWLGVVPFFMRNVRPTWSPSVPYLSHFLELNLRTYVYDSTGRPGVWFFSLAANRLLAVKVAQTFFHLPYVWSSMSFERSDDRTILYRSQRKDDPQRKTFELTYEKQSAVQPAEPDSLEFFLVERYVLFAETPNGEIRTGQVHHAPYKIAKTIATGFEPELFELDGLPRLERPPESVLYSPGVNVEVYPLKSAGKMSSK